jgi:hypothetical protein
MFESGGSFVFQRVTDGIRKPVVRFRLASGRRVELLGFHLEPGWAIGGETPRPVLEEVVRRLYPNESPVVVADLERVQGNAYLCLAYLCLAYLYSDTPVRRDKPANYSALLLCGLIGNIDKGVKGVRAIVAEMLSQVEWEACATEDFMW